MWRCVCSMKTKPLRYLWSHAAPEVGVRRSGLQHRRHNGLVLTHQLPQRVRIGEQVVTVGHLQTEEKGTISTRLAHTHKTWTCKHGPNAHLLPRWHWMIDRAAATRLDHTGLWHNVPLPNPFQPTAQDLNPAWQTRGTFICWCVWLPPRVPAEQTSKWRPLPVNLYILFSLHIHQVEFILYIRL